MQVIEKVKVVPEGYNGAGMNYDGGMVEIGNVKEVIKDYIIKQSDSSLFYLSKF